MSGDKGDRSRVANCQKSRNDWESRKLSNFVSQERPLQLTRNQSSELKKSQTGDNRIKLENTTIQFLRGNLTIPSTML